MDFKERLPSDKEIKNSLDTYFDTFHTCINVIGDLDVNKMMELKRQGWNLDLLSNIDEFIDHFVNIYGFIYKNGNVNRFKQICRGTSTLEAESLRSGSEIGSALSVTDEEEIAKRFATNGSALIRIGANDVPMVYVEDLKDRGSDTEEEYLLLPFSKVKTIQHVSDWDGIHYYSMGIERQQLPEINEEELNALRSEMTDGFSNFFELAQQCQKARDNWEIKDNYIKRNLHSLSREDKEFERGKSESLYSEYASIKAQVDAYREKFSKMLKGLCKQREKDIDLQVQNEIAESKAKAIAEENEKHEKLVADISASKQSIIDQLSRLKSQIGTTSLKYKKLSENLGVQTYNSQYSVSTGINEKSDMIIEELAKHELPDTNNTLEQYTTAYSVLNVSIEGLISEFESKSFEEVKQSLNEKVKSVIESCIRSKTSEQRKYIESHKTPLFQRVFGGNRLKEAQLRNLDASQNLAIAQNRTSNSKNSVRQMLLEMYKCGIKYYGGDLTPEMQEIEEAIRENFDLHGNPLPSSDEIREKAKAELSNSQQNNLPQVYGQKPSRFNILHTRSEAIRLDNDTATLKEETKAIEENYKPSKNSSSVGEIYSRIIKTLDSTKECIEQSKDEPYTSFYMEMDDTLK